MGQYVFKPELQREVEEYKAPRIGYSHEVGTSYWDHYNTSKNADYYFSKKRCTYISREHYVNDYTKGWIYGRYERKHKTPSTQADDPTDE
jgi:hypothetical protein|tara:strand:- start:2514 stop:2783 length:270 start_codon:yes stop_codon:yes gene_type:complete